MQIRNQNLIFAGFFHCKNKLLIKNYQFISSAIVGCIYFPGFSLIDIKSKLETNCNKNYFYKLEKKIEENNNSIIIFGGRFPLYLEKNNFNNSEGGKDLNLWMKEKKFIQTGNFETINSSFQNSVEKLSKNNIIILVYPKYAVKMLRIFFVLLETFKIKKL